jgi:hypothetical protein
MSERPGRLARMSRIAPYDSRALAELLARQDGVIGRAQAFECAMTESAVRHRLLPDGPWQVVLPGVYLTSCGTSTVRQRSMAAFLYAGKVNGEAMAITGPAALTWHRIRVRASDDVDVLVKSGCRRRNVGFARLHPTSVMPSVAFRDGALIYAPPARAVADTVRQLSEPADIRAVVAAGVQQGRVQVWQLAEELTQGPVRGSAGLRRALAEVAEGVRSTAEADLVRLIRRHRLPMPMLNPRLFIGGEFLAMPDAWWPQAGVAVEVDSREWHLSPAEWEQTMARHARMSTHGIIVLHYPPSRIRAAGREVAAEIRSALDAARGRPLQPILARPAR